MKTKIIKIFAKILTLFLRLESWLCKPFGVKNRVAIISRQSNSPTLDIAILKEHLDNRKVKTVVLTRMMEKGLVKMVRYAFHLLRQVYYVSTSKVVVIDGYCIAVSVIKKSPKTKVIQMWHALGAIKKFGWQNVDSPDGHGRAVAGSLNMHGNYDYVVAPSVVTGRFFAEGFNVSEESVIYQGLPRIDFLRADNSEMLEKITDSYPEIKDKRNILYAPTFRKNTGLEIEELIKAFDFKNNNLILKKHFLDKADYGWAKEYGTIVDEDYSSMEWLRVCDGIITDYSAIMFEAAILNRALYIYQQDLKDYACNVGLNVDLTKEAISRYVSTSSKDLVEKIGEEYDRAAVKSFTNKFIEINIDNCTDRLCDFIENLLD